MAAKKKPIIRSTQFINTIDTSVESLNEALNKGEVAVTRRSKDSLKQLALIRRLKKKKQTLLNRKTRATAIQKKAPSAEIAKQIRDSGREIESIKKQLTKATALRQANLAELSVIRANLRRASAYVRAINSAENQLNKPKKRRRRTAKA